MKFQESLSYRYHCSTKHSLQSLYSSNHKLDWALQPDPFRRYQGSEKVLLPREFELPERNFWDLLQLMNTGFKNLNESGACKTKTVGSRTEPASLEVISALLYYSMAISAWKEIKGTEHRWALRVNPSSGNLHPTETHLLLHGIDGIENGAYHYSVKDHTLEKRAGLDLIFRVWELLDFEAATPPQILICLSSIFWREAWKYRDRAYRYCQLDMGHAAAAVSLGAAACGWQARLISEFPDRELSDLLCLPDDEKPLLLIAFSPIANSPADPIERKDLVIEPGPVGAGSDFSSTPNRLSSKEIEYKSIEAVHSAGVLSPDQYIERKEQLKKQISFSEIELPPAGEIYKLAELCYQPMQKYSAFEVIRKRRSAVDMDGELRISLARMSSILMHSSRGVASSFSDFLDWPPVIDQMRFYIHILLYVHRVDGIAPGIYLFDRRSGVLSLLSQGDVRNHAKYVSCLQDISYDGVFAVSLLADMDAAFATFGERAYRYVHQEAGFIGHLFYLTAKSLDIDATGIGCFLDDEINKSMPPGVEAVYNFTFGRAVDDPRLTSLPAYSWSSGKDA